MSKFKAIIEHLKYHLFMLRAEYSTLSFWLAKTISQSILFLAFFTTLYIISENKELRLEIDQLKVNQKELYLKIDQLEVTQGGLQQKKTIDNIPSLTPSRCKGLGSWSGGGGPVKCVSGGKVFILSGSRIAKCAGQEIAMVQLENGDILADCFHHSAIVTISQ